MLTLVLLTALAAGIGVGAVIATPRTPEVLASGATLTEAPVTTRQFVDSRTVTLRVSRGDARQLTTRSDGLLTRVDCTVGATLASGSSSFAIDGAPLVSLHTAEPLWRTLAVGDRGADVTAVHEALRGLGHEVPDGDRVTAGTLQAYRSALTSAGVPAPPASQPVDPAAIVWLPERSVTVSRCLATTGASITLGDPLAELPAVVTSASLIGARQDTTPGDRVVAVDEYMLPVDADGSLRNPDSLAVLAASRSFAEAEIGVEAGAEVTLTVPWSLVTPLEVSVVPPAAVIGAGTPSACVRDADGRSTAVVVVGSELGQTYLVPEDGEHMPATVRTEPTGSCGD